MSAEATGWVYRHSPFKGLTFLVHLAVADSVNDQHDNEFFMSVAKLAKKVRSGSRLKVTAAIQVLTNGGWLEMVEERSGYANRYRFVFLEDLPVMYEGRRTKRTRSQGDQGGDPTEHTHPIPEGSPIPVGVEPKVEPKGDLAARGNGSAPSAAQDEPQGPTHRAMFEQVALVCGWPLEQLTKGAAGRVAAAAKELRGVGASLQDVQAFAMFWESHYGEDVDLTPQAISGNWAAFKGGKLFTDRRRRR